MTKPLLQIALDAKDLDSALRAAEIIADKVDILEVGTILAFAEGLNAVRTLRKKYPNHIIVCDMKILDAGDILTGMAFEAGTNWITVGAGAHIETIRSANKLAQQHNGEVQIELFGKWDLEDAQLWLDAGVKQAIYHRSRDAQAAGVSWTEEDLKIMKELSDLGIELSITGGIVPQDIHLFKNINAKAFIAGRALASEGGQQTADAFHNEFEKYW
ncbi:3-keto-L-gulonate-6-phosphate decarboxylase UlaD [Vibrio sp. HN007]|uniref:3-keto-L-gulonate-6-phosphate decarboxylase UlaD n=1 Tax=Vibrio iocasae TaxID=3098914 RepID=UPI0035D4D0B6